MPGRAEPIRAAVRASSREVEVALSLVRTAFVNQVLRLGYTTSLIP